MKKLVTNSVVAVAVLFGGVALSAKGLTHEQMIQKSVKSEMQKQNKQFDKTTQKLVIALHNTYKALSALEYGKDKEALKLLKIADKDFSDILKKNPDLKLIPIENRVKLFAFEGNSSDIKEAIESAVKLLKNNRAQSARDILVPLKDEMDITTLFIPMQTYPAVIKTAIKQLDKGDKLSATKTILDGINTIVAQEVQIPLSFLMAQDLIENASKLDKTKKDEAVKMLSLASDELNKAVLLGYASKDDMVYQNLQKSIKNIEKEIKGKNKVEKLYENLKNDFKSFIDKFRQDKHDAVNRAEAKVNKYQQEQMKKAIEESKKFKSEVKEDLTKTVK